MFCGGKRSMILITNPDTDPFEKKRTANLEISAVSKISNKQHFHNGLLLSSAPPFIFTSD
jgi:hypothetical protein